MTTHNAPRDGVTQPARRADTARRWGGIMRAGYVRVLRRALRAAQPKYVITITGTITDGAAVAKAISNKMAPPPDPETEP